jgi:hypothetical protein
MEHLIGTFPSETRTIADMSAIMEKIEGFVRNCRDEDRFPLVAIYRLYHLFSTRRRENWEAFLGTQERYCQRCGIESMAMWAFHSKERFPWTVEECESVFENYLERRNRVGAVNLPCQSEISVMAQIANLWMSDATVDRFSQWIERAILDAAGRRELQAYLNECKSNYMAINPQIILGLESQASGGQKIDN